MTIILQTNGSERNRLDKDLTSVSTLTGTLKVETSVTDPTIVIEADLEDLAEVNYFTVTEFGRSYFVTGMRSIRTGLVEIAGHVDVLTSFAEGIRSNLAILARQENDWNLYLNDGVLKVYQDPMILTKPFPSGFTAQEFILAVAGSAPAQGGE